MRYLVYVGTSLCLDYARVIDAESLEEALVGSVAMERFRPTHKRLRPHFHLAYNLERNRFLMVHEPTFGLDIPLRITADGAPITD